MSKLHKLNMTRPEFLLKFITDGEEELLTLDELQRVLPVSHDLIYCTYTVLMESDLRASDIPFVSNDGDTIVLKFSAKKKAREIAKENPYDTIRLGVKIYDINVKAKESYLFISIEENTENEDE